MDVTAAPDRARAIEWLALIGGVVAILAAVSPPADEIADRSFSAHMVQHIVLTNVGALLLAVAWPLVLGRWRRSGFTAFLNWLARPAPAILIVVSSAALWFWHIPAVYDAAFSNDLVHGLEHLVFIGAFLLYWRPLMNDSMSGDHLRTNEARIFYLMFGMLATSALAAYITLSGHLIYSHYAESSPGGRTPLQDQHIGGAIMMVSAAVTTTVVAVLTLRDEPAEPIGQRLEPK